MVSKVRTQIPLTTVFCITNRSQHHHQRKGGGNTQASNKMSELAVSRAVEIAFLPRSPPLMSKDTVVRLLAHIA